MINVLITGADGQLGTSIIDFKDHFTNYNIIPTDRDVFDISNLQGMVEFINGKNIDYIINCAAYTNVDKAEKDVDAAYKINYLGVSHLTTLCKENNIKLVHVSTDYVFDGKSCVPLKECDSTNPIGVYGKSKRKGEISIIDSDVEYLIIRTSWLYSEHGHNFVKSIIRLSSEKDKLTMIADQAGTPTYAKDLALTILKLLPLINEENKGIYHYSNEGIASWYDFAMEIISLSNIECELVPIETKDYKTLAQRPSYSVLNKRKIKEVFNIDILYWKNSLSKCIKLIYES